MKKSNLYRDLLLVSNLYPNRIAFKKKLYRLTYRKLIKLIDTVSRYLYSLGFKKGDLISIVSDYKKENLILFYASSKIGLNIKEIDFKNKALIGTLESNGYIIDIVRNKHYVHHNYKYLKWNNIFLNSFNFYLPIFNGKSEINYFKKIHEKLILNNKRIVLNKYNLKKG